MVVSYNSKSRSYYITPEVDIYEHIWKRHNFTNLFGIINARKKTLNIFTVCVWFILTYILSLNNAYIIFRFNILNGTLQSNSTTPILYAFPTA